MTSRAGFSLVLAVFFLIFSYSGVAHAQGGNADCNLPGMCQFGTTCNKQPGVIGKPCFKVVNGFTSTGACVAPMVCETTGTSDGKGPDQGLSKLGEMLGKLLEQLMKAGQGGGGDQGGQPTNGQTCTTLQPTQDRVLVAQYPGCYFYQEGTASTTPTIYDPSGGLVANPLSGTKPLQVVFSYNNGTADCGTPPMFIDFGDGNSENLPTYASSSSCAAITETITHTFTSDGSYTVRMKDATTQAVKGGVTVTVGAGTATSTTPSPDNSNTNTNTNTGTNTNTNTNTNGSTTNVFLNKTGSTNNTNSNISNTLFDTPLNNLNKTGSVSTGGSNGTQTGGSVSTGGSNKNDDGAALNFDTPQSIVQSIIQKNVQPGAYGDVKILENGTTIIAGNRGKNSEVVGFFGLSGGTTQQGSAVQRLCTARPWGTNFLSFIIPSTFFDSLCTWRGYSVGPKTTTPPPTTTTTAPKTQVQPAQTGKTQPKTTQPTTTPPATNTAAKPKVDIWASPTTVPLGARTSIFWNTSNVQSCVQTSPDGSFSHKTLQGGASTVPLASATTFTISCIGLDGLPYTDNVTVMIAI